jgi:hypothetical protein
MPARRKQSRPAAIASLAAACALSEPAAEDLVVCGPRHEILAAAFARGILAGNNQDEDEKGGGPS